MKVNHCRKQHINKMLIVCVYRTHIWIYMCIGENAAQCDTYSRDGIPWYMNTRHIAVFTWNMTHRSHHRLTGLWGSLFCIRMNRWQHIFFTHITDHTGKTAQLHTLFYKIPSFWIARVDIHTCGFDATQGKVQYKTLVLCNWWDL